MGNHKGEVRKLMCLINKLGKVSGYKVNIQKSVAFLYTNNEISERELRNQFQLPLHQEE